MSNLGILSYAQIGKIYDKITTAYEPDELSTGHCYHTNWSPINYTEFYYPTPDYDTRQLPAQLKAHNQNSPAPIQSGDDEQNDPAGATALGPGEDTAKYSQEGSKPSNPAHNGQDDPAGDTVEILGDDIGGAKSDVTGFMQISNLAATSSAKSLQYAAETNSDGSRFPSPSIRTDNDEVLGAAYAGDAPLHEGPDGIVVLGTLILPPGPQTTPSGHIISRRGDNKKLETAGGSTDNTLRPCGIR
ncbi:hypothetical protein OEA41_009494 [Lepraria neglecta]|uniref:Uncharacterized protein n=1 Tax=Lepraria neglecta TaxID=209136 RepID=A0AAD9Z5Y1_9LECA|nr:hypothetical protein OEA41_009494 [Lepraria neglecta]